MVASDRADEGAGDVTERVVPDELRLEPDAVESSAADGVDLPRFEVLLDDDVARLRPPREAFLQSTIDRDRIDLEQRRQFDGDRRDVRALRGIDEEPVATGARGNETTAPVDDR